MILCITKIKTINNIKHKLRMRFSVLVFIVIYVTTLLYIVDIF